MRACASSSLIREVSPIDRPKSARISGLALFDQAANFVAMKVQRSGGDEPLDSSRFNVFAGPEDLTTVSDFFLERTRSGPVREANGTDHRLLENVHGECPQHLAGRQQRNICIGGMRGCGAQLEIAIDLRAEGSRPLLSCASSNCRARHSDTRAQLATCFESFIVPATECANWELLLDPSPNLRFDRPPLRWYQSWH
jgi:hypothetical protein